MIHIDIDKDPTTSGRFKVTGIPDVRFLDSDGKEIKEYNGDRTADSFVKEIEEIASKHTKGLPFQSSLDDAIKLGKDEKKPVVLFFGDGKDNSRAMEKTLLDAVNKDIIPKFVWVRVEYKKNSDDVKKYKISKVPTLVVIDPNAEKPEEAPLGKLEGKKMPKETRKALEKILKDLEKK